MWDQARVREEESQFLGQVRTSKFLDHLDHFDLLEVFFDWRLQQLQEEITPEGSVTAGASEPAGAPEVQEDPATLETLKPPTASEILELLIYWSL